MRSIAPPVLTSQIRCRLSLTLDSFFHVWVISIRPSAVPRLMSIECPKTLRNIRFRMGTVQLRLIDFSPFRRNATCPLVNAMRSFVCCSTCIIHCPELLIHRLGVKGDVSSLEKSEPGTGTGLCSSVILAKVCELHCYPVL